MKKKIFFLLASFFLFCYVHAQQSWESSINFGYLTNGNVQFIEGFVDIGNAPTYQFNFGTSSARFRDVEIEYKFTPKQSLNFDPNSFANNQFDAFSTKFTTHTIGLNGLNYLSQNRTTRPYAIFGMYAAIFDFEVPGIKNVTSMAFRFGLGAKHYFSEKFGIKAQISYNAPVQFNGTGIYADIGTGGSGVGLSLNSSVLYSQGDFLFGLIYKFNNRTIE